MSPERSPEKHCLHVPCNWEAINISIREIASRFGRRAWEPGSFAVQRGARSRLDLNIHRSFPATWGRQIRIKWTPERRDLTSPHDGDVADERGSIEGSFALRSWQWRNHTSDWWWQRIPQLQSLINNMRLHNNERVLLPVSSPRVWASDKTALGWGISAIAFLVSETALRWSRCECQS